MLGDTRPVVIRPGGSVHFRALVPVQSHARGGLWRRSGDDQQELLRHANGNRIRIQFLP